MLDLKPGSKAVLGFSGGVDSVVLSQFLLDRYNIRPYLLHVNYGLREESDEDARWCQWYAQEYRFEIQVLNADPSQRSGENVQNWARKVRYAWFQERAEALGAEYIFTAHHMDDRRETFLMNALRGSGLIGITGMNSALITRPLAHLDKGAILDYAKERELPWREDASNKSLKYTRNKFRNLLAPILDEVEPRWMGGLKKTVENLERDRDLLLGFMTQWKSEWTTTSGKEVMVKMGPWVKSEVGQNLLYKLAQQTDSGFNFEEVGHVLRGDVGQMTRGKNHLLIKDREFFFLVPAYEKDTRVYFIDSFEALDQLPFQLHLEKTSTSACIFDAHHEYLSEAAVQFPWTVRLWRPGDTFRPLGMNGSKKISDFLNNLRLPRHRKEQTYVVLKNETIIWVLGHRIAESARVGEGDNFAYLATLKIT
ncbi:MAG: tRNA lysidine(34) synthetase TilS [Schleiferiaceae bacterium]|jgi:tRNA(Ile)-lysidine synthase|nr:tRNA lysidine(34) synthetase TilS [Schleiferiaceae bacterium]